jgi:hypothetical protein
MSRGRGRVFTKFYKCPKCGHENKFRLRRWEFDCSPKKTHRHCKQCNEEIHFTNYCSSYSHPMNSKKKNEEIKEKESNLTDTGKSEQEKEDNNIVYSCAINCDE